PATPAATAAPGTPEAMPGSISITMLDTQLFHPDTRRRLMADPRNPADVSAESSGGFGVGVLLEARNDSEYVLGAPRILSDVVIHGTHGAAGCRVVPRRRSFWSRNTSPITVLSPTRDQRTPWVDESRNAYELVWRPQETVRIRAVLECGPVHLLDINPTGLTGSFVVAATAPFAEHEVTCDNDYEICGDDVMGRTPDLTLPARAFTLQSVTLPAGPPGFLAGDIFVHAEAGRPIFDSITTFGSSAFRATSADLPPAPVPVLDRQDEWSLSIDSVSLTHWSDRQDLPKGTRLVTVQARVSIATAGIEGRMRGAIDQARAVEQTALQQLAQAQAASAAAPDDPAASDALRAAESAARDATSAVGRAQQAYDRNLGSERSRMARLLACDRVQLVTHARLLRPANARDAATACSAINTGDQASVSWLFVVDRYEVPVGLTYNVGSAPHTGFFAAQSLATFDAR
ncbi:MAG: hypothetical protein K1X94_28685, partial [Sandaracinaceae bacterium]|nr:hypothetical protein [Sandaracinaceae bacterium]